jgi:hypothetical protein
LCIETSQKTRTIDANIIDRCRCGLLKKFNKLTQNIDELQKKNKWIYLFCALKLRKKSNYQCLLIDVNVGWGAWRRRGKK